MVVEANQQNMVVIDFYIKVGSPILAAGNEKVYGVKIKDKCVGKILVKGGDTVKRGQVVAEAGTRVKKNCGGGMEYLHFHMSKKSKSTFGSHWGS